MSFDNQCVRLKWIMDNYSVCFSFSILLKRQRYVLGLKLEIQRGTAVIKRGSFRKRVKGFGPLGAFKAIRKWLPYNSHFFLQGTQKCTKANMERALILARGVWLFGEASRPFQRVSEAMALAGLGLIRALCLFHKSNDIHNFNLT